MASKDGVFSKHSTRFINSHVHQKGNLLNNQRRLLDSALVDPKKNYTDKVTTVVQSWESVDLLVSSTHLEDTRRYLIGLHRSTVLVVLNLSWKTIKTLIKTHLKNMVERCAVALKESDKEWESCCRAILGLVEEPWGKTVGSVVDGTCTETDAEQFLASDRLILRLRLQAVLETRAFKIAAGLLEFVWRWRRLRPNFFTGYSNKELHYMVDIYLILLLALKRDVDIVLKLKELNLEECFDVVRRLSSACQDDLSVGEKRLWRHAPKIAKLGSQLLLTKAMLGVCTPQLADYVHTWFQLHKEMVNKPEQLLDMIRKIHSHAKSMSHVVTFCKVLHSVLGKAQRPVCIELYIRTLTNEMNLMERHRSQREPAEAHEAELRLSEGFIELSNVLENWKVRRECVLTAFSLNPTTATLELLSSMAQLPNDLDTGQQTNCDDGPEPTNAQPAPQPTPESAAQPAPQSSLDALSLGLSESLCKDLEVVLFCHRFQDLNWNVGWAKLEEECKRYLKKVETGARNLDPELKYLNIDYDLFKDWPEEEDADNGIEKGYEPTSTSSEEEDVSDDTYGSESSDYADHRRRRLKKSKPVSDSSDDTASDVVTKTGIGRPKKYKSRRGRNKYLDSRRDSRRDTKMGFQFQRKDKIGRPLGRPPLNKKPGMRHSGRGYPVSLPSSKPTIGRPSGRPLGRPPTRLARPGPRPALRAEPRIVVRQGIGRPIGRPLGRPPSRPPVGRPPLPGVSVKVEKDSGDLNDAVVRNLLSPSKSPNSASVVKTLRNYRTPKKKHMDVSSNDDATSPSRERNREREREHDDSVSSRFAPLLSTLNLNPKIVLNPRDPLVEQYMCSSKRSGDLKKTLASSVPGLDSLDMIVPCPQQATVQVVQIGQTPTPGQSSEGTMVKTESGDDKQCSDHVNGGKQAGSNPSSGDPPPTQPATPTPSPTPSPTTPAMLSNLVTENHSGLLRLRPDSASSMQVSSTQGNELLESNAAVVSSSHNWPGAPPKPDNKKTEKRHRKQMSTQTSLPQFHQAFAKQLPGFPTQQGASAESRPTATPAPVTASATVASASVGTSSVGTSSIGTSSIGASSIGASSVATVSIATAIVVTASVATTSVSTASVATATVAATSGHTTSAAASARGGNALKQALAGGNSARLIKGPGESSLILQAISSDNVVQEEVKLPIRSGSQLSEKQRPSMLMKQLTAPVTAAPLIAQVKPPTNLLLASNTSAVIVNSSSLHSGSPLTFGSSASSSESLATKSVNTQTTATATATPSPRDAVITSAQLSSAGVGTTPSPRPLPTQNVYIVRRKPIETSTGTLNLSASAVSSSQNASSPSLASDDDKTNRASMSMAFNRRGRRAPVTVQAPTLKLSTVKPGGQERFPAPLLSILNQCSPRAPTETPLTGGTPAASATTSPGSRPIRQATPPALVTSTTLEQQLREFESVLEQVKERRLNPEDPSPPPVTTASLCSAQSIEKPLELQETSPSPSVNAVVVTSPSASAVGVTLSTQAGVAQSIHKLSPIVVSTSFTQTVAVPSPASVTSQSSSSPSTTPSSSVPGTPSKSSKSKPKSVKTSAVQASVKTSPIAKSQKTQEDEQTTARILSILRQYDEQLRCSPDLNNKPAPRRRNNHQTHPSPNSKRKKSGGKSKPSSASDMSPSTDDTHTLGSEDSSGMASQPSGEMADPALTEDETPSRTSIFSAVPTVGVPSTPSTTPSPTPSHSTPTLVATHNSATQQSDTSPRTSSSENKTELETKPYSNVMPVYMVPVSSASSLPVVVSTGTQMLHVHPVGPNGAPLVGVGLGGNVQVPVVVRQIPAKQLPAVTTLEGAVQAQSANTSSVEMVTAANTESRPETILLNVTAPTRTGNASQPVMAIMPTFHQILTTVSSANTSSGTPTTHIRLPVTAASSAATTVTVATSSSDMPLSGESETAPNARPATLLGLQLLQQQRTAKQRAQPKASEQPSQLQQLLSQDQPTPPKPGHVFRCVMKSVKTEQEPPILLQIAKVRDDSHEGATNQLSVQVSSPQHRVLKPPQPVTTIAATSSEPVVQALSQPMAHQEVVLMRQASQPVQQVEQVQPQVLQLLQAPTPPPTMQPTQTIKSEPPKLQVQPASLNAVPHKVRPPGQLISQPAVQTQVVQQPTPTRPVAASTLAAQQTTPSPQPVFTVQISQRHQQFFNLQNMQEMQGKQQLQALQITHQTRLMHLQAQQKQHLIAQSRQQLQALAETQPKSQQPQPQVQSQPTPSASPGRPVEGKPEMKVEAASPPAVVKPKEEEPVTAPLPPALLTAPSGPPSGPPRGLLSGLSSGLSSRLSSRLSSELPSGPPSGSEGENTNVSSGDCPANSNAINTPSSGIVGDASPDHSPGGGPMTCWRYTESSPGRDQVKVSAKHSSVSLRCSSQPLGQVTASSTGAKAASAVATVAASTASTTAVTLAVTTAATTAAVALAAANKRKPPLNMYPCSLSKSLSEECEDLGVDRPSARELFPDTDLFLDSNLSPSYAHTDSPSNSQDGDGVSVSPEPPDKKKKFPLLRSFPSHKSEFLCDGVKEEHKQNGEVAIDAITAGVALASEVTAASPLPVLASSIASSREDASSPDASMVFMHQGRVTTYGRRRDSRPIRDEWESEPLRAVATSDMDDDFWHEPLVDDKDESLTDLDGHCSSPASNGTDPLASRVSNVAAAVAAVAAAAVAKPLSTTMSMTTRRGALKRKDAHDAVDSAKRDMEKKTEKKVKRSVLSRPASGVDPEEEDVAEEKRGRPKRTVMNRTEVFARDAKKRASEEAPWREPSATTPTVAHAPAPTPPASTPTTVRRTSLRARYPGQPGSPAASIPAVVETALVVSAPTPATKSVTKLDRNSKKSKASKSIKGVAHKKK